MRDSNRTVWLEREDMGLWDEFVGEHRFGSIYHTSCWKSVIEKSFRHITGRVVAVKDADSRILSGIPVYVVTSPFLGIRLVCAPFATSCDPLVSSPDDTQLLVQEIVACYGRVGAGRIELRTHRTQPVPELKGFSVSRAFKCHDLDLGQGIDSIHRNVSRRELRMVSRAVRSGITVRTGSTENEVHQFHRLLMRNRKRLGLPFIPYVFFESLWNCFREEGVDLRFAIQNGREVGGYFALRFKGEYLAEYSAEEAHMRNTGAIQLLIWSAITQAAQDGCKRFSFGRTSAGNSGLMTFKAHWGAKESENPTLVYTNSSGILEGRFGEKELVRSVLRHTPYWAYSLLGKVFYQHWG